jgi:hypothetical protein
MLLKLFLNKSEKGRTIPPKKNAASTSEPQPSSSITTQPPSLIASQHQSRISLNMARNRKSKPAQPLSTSADIPLALPDFNALPSGKTLLDLADEKRGIRIMQVNPSSSKSGTEPRIIELNRDEDDEDEEDEEDEMPAEAGLESPFATALLYTISLCAVHTTLDVIVLTQYAQEMSAASIAGRLARLAPALLLVVYFLHHPLVAAWPRVRQVFFLGAAIAAGCWLMYAGNEYGYYQVMKRAPPLGTLWVWSVVEMDLLLILAHLAVVGGYTWWNDYGNF